MHPREARWSDLAGLFSRGVRVYRLGLVLGTSLRLGKFVMGKLNGMKWGLVVIWASACSTFSGADSVGDPAESEQVDAGTDAMAGAIDGGTIHPPVTDDTVALQVSSAEQRIVQGASLQIPVKLVRGEHATGAVQITVTGLRAGLTAPPMTMTGNDGTLLLAAADDIAQGPAAATIEAVLGDVHVTAPLNLFVRGPSGSVDTTFAKNGIYEEPGSGSTELKLVAKPDGTMLAAYRCSIGMCVRHLSTDGAVDETYGASGVGSVGLYVQTGYIFDVLASLGTDDKLSLAICAGPPTSGSILRRLMPTGAEDIGLNGGQGLRHSPIRSFYEVVPDGDEVLLASNVAGNPSIVLERYTKDGVVDSKFGTVNPYVASDSSKEFVVGLTVRQNGNVAMLATYHRVDANNSGYVGITELDGATGSPIANFGSKGRAAIYMPQPFSASGTTRTVTWLKNGKAVGALFSSDGYWLFSFLKNGLPDPQFGKGGNGLVGPLTLEGMKPVATAEATDGKLFVVLFPLVDWGGAGEEGRLVRFTATGEVDSSFGNGGVVNLPASAGDQFFDAIVQADGRIVVASTRTSKYFSDADRLIVARYWD